MLGLYNKDMERNILILVEYNGANFFGWQKQKSKRTVQGVIEEKISLLTGEEVSLEGSGRTDKGVHALGQVATFLTHSPIPLQNLKVALNKLLPQDIVVKKVGLAPIDFHPRFSAKRKTYVYVVDTRKTRRAIDYDRVTYYPYKINFERMQSAGNIFIGRHNFKAFCASNATVKTFEREIFDLKIRKSASRIVFEITGDGFLYNMVRIIVGTLLQIDKIGEENIDMALKTGDRSLVGKTMPPNGLYLKNVEYA